MQRLKDLFSKTGFAVFVFFLSVFFFGWPFLSLIKHDQLENMFFYLFIVWAFIIGLLYFMSRSYQGIIRKREEPDGDK